MPTRWLARALEASALVVVLSRCTSQPPASAPRETVPAKSIVLSWPGWSPNTAITTCRAAIDEARGATPSLERASALMVACASLVGGPRCRAVTEKQWGSRPAPSFRDAVAVCGEEYCPRLTDAPNLAACGSGSTDGAFDSADAWVRLRQSMLLHDFPESELPSAARALDESTDYVRSVAPPATASSSSGPPAVEVRLDTGGGLTVFQHGKERGTVASLSELPRLVPKPSGDSRITIRAPSDAAYERVIQVVNALQSMGYAQVSFSTSQP
ncbi:MAG TPA: biopolymer transporter ExbD [Polyangiaceae bacterium]